MSAKIETPEEMADRISETTAGRNYAKHAVEFRDEQIAAWCDAQAENADKEGAACDARITGRHGDERHDRNEHESAILYEGQASAFRSLAAIIRGSPA